MAYRPSHFRMSSQYEPEGIYLQLPLSVTCRLIQGWGAHPKFYGRFTYNGVPLKGHPGLDFAAAPGADVVAADQGRVVALSNEPGGFGRYVKLEHRWGESLYAQLGVIRVETGQRVERGQVIAQLDTRPAPYATHLHFAIRTAPFNRFDGWGGFSDPLPFLYVDERSEAFDPVQPAAIDGPDDDTTGPLPPFREEKPGMRRP